MTEITAILVKELRERTGLGIMDCKNALTAVNGDIELAIENMRKSGSIKAAKKAGNIATEGLIEIKSGNDYGLILEINCETDFVAKDIIFQNFANKVLNTAVISKVTNVEYLKKQFEEERIALISRIGENINIRRIAILEGAEINSYKHGMHIGVLISTKGVNKELSKQIAMHIAASKPEFVNPEDIHPNIIEKEYKIQFDIAMLSSKSKEIAKKIVVGRMKKFTEEISLTGQKFIFDPSKNIGQILKEKNANVIDFIRFEVGEGIVRREQN